jgi:hypothetical protein
MVRIRFKFSLFAQNLEEQENRLSADIFLSVGHALTPEQELFVEAVKALLKSHDMAPRTVPRTDLALKQPLKHITEVMRACSGTIVVALKRIQIINGTELQDSSGTSQLTNVSLPTVWNQIEAAMAYSMEQPLIAIVETGLRNEGVLEEDYDWYVKWLDLNPESLTEHGFLELFALWKKNVMNHQLEQFHRGNLIVSG